MKPGHDSGAYIVNHFSLCMAALSVILRHKPQSSATLHSILASRQIDRLKKLDAKDIVGEYEVDMLMLDG